MQKIYPERRQSVRCETRIQAWIALPGRPRRQCVIWNCTRRGALIEIIDDGLLPFRFPLAMGKPEQIVICEARHQDRNLLGVQFKYVSGGD